MRSDVVVNFSGCLYQTSGINIRPTGENGADNGIGFDASRSNPIYGNSSTVQPNSLLVMYVIRF